MVDAGWNSIQHRCLIGLVDEQNIRPVFAFVRQHALLFHCDNVMFYNAKMLFVWRHQTINYLNHYDK